jgi:hypothetical protein
MWQVKSRNRSIFNPQLIDKINLGYTLDYVYVLKFKFTAFFIPARATLRVVYLGNLFYFLMLCVCSCIAPIKMVTKAISDKITGAMNVIVLCASGRAVNQPEDTLSCGTIKTSDVSFSI